MEAFKNLINSVKCSINKIKHHIEYFGKKKRCAKDWGLFLFVCVCVAVLQRSYAFPQPISSSAEYKTPVLLSSLAWTVTKNHLCGLRRSICCWKKCYKYFNSLYLVIHPGIILETQALLLTYSWKVDALNTGEETCEVRLTRFSRARVLPQTALKHGKLTRTVAPDLSYHRTALRWKKNRWKYTYILPS